MLDDDIFPLAYVPLDPEKDRKIQWSDTVLEGKVRQWIDKKEGDIYLSDLWDVTALKLDRCLDLDLSDDQITTEEWKKVRLPRSIRKVYLTRDPITDLETEREYPGLEVIFEGESQDIHLKD